jgi:hypothetical protein
VGGTWAEVKRKAMPGAGESMASARASAAGGAARPERRGRGTASSSSGFEQQPPPRGNAYVRFESGPAQKAGLPKVVRVSPNMLRIETNKLLCEFLLLVLSV